MTTEQAHELILTLQMISAALWFLAVTVALKK